MLAAIALGSNLEGTFGSPEENIRAAFLRLSALGEVKATSSLYVTTPVGYLDQPNFVNAAALLETQLAPLELLRGLLAIEREFGRDRSANAISKGPRTLDLDLLLYGEEVMNTEELTLPHPAMHERRFVLEPLAEIAPTLLHPTLQITIAELLSALSA
ncbi:2-amino-4-hydroxy-6-hydroxymethyldihydropteridine diphosphokinase [Granulicella cerasi]|uniref:2-amino-4-hydroxy-6-hydroxymethyldihydropteridine pyrophosphokinase n=1 Tax=Granulicella cerasi TaxID=741063 RepID=A0ABW1Z9Z9_9BACT|nr:2-amino-4-hydroxy-6-hydroxymethyldihydropteridine diphosphokinase [Granulicella cerasi]